jgi:hypothetical protein
MIDKAFALGEQNNIEEELKVYDELIELFRDNQDADVQERVARALFNKVNTLERQGKLRFL